jgi:hypothetical protein
MSEQEKRRSKNAYRALFDHGSAILVRHDPIGITFETNADEYESEARTILPRLADCESADDVQQVTYEEFVRWFDDSTVGPFETYQSIAQEIWQVWTAYSVRSSLKPPDGTPEAD